MDLYDALQARLKREHVPFTVLWELTHVCNLDCVMCYNVPQPEPELTTAECLDILEQLAAAGTLRLTLTGGEILTRRDFFIIAERARALGFALDLKTNGTLITPERADRLAALHPMQVDISLLGATRGDQRRRDARPEHAAAHPARGAPAAGARRARQAELPAAGSQHRRAGADAGPGAWNWASTTSRSSRYRPRTTARWRTRRTGASCRGRR